MLTFQTWDSMAYFPSIYILVSPYWARLNFQAEQNWTFLGNWWFQDACWDSLSLLLVPFLRPVVPSSPWHPEGPSHFLAQALIQFRIEPWVSQRLSLLMKKTPKSLPQDQIPLKYSSDLRYIYNLEPSSHLSSSLHVPWSTCASSVMLCR